MDDRIIWHQVPLGQGESWGWDSYSRIRQVAFEHRQHTELRFDLKHNPKWETQGQFAISSWETVNSMNKQPDSSSGMPNYINNIVNKFEQTHVLVQMYQKTW